ncbi:C40 family peptidase [Pseudonocardia phyllosphaerae]|uniref:C40 family peptidase n=1 Tax=Pseudonocardia phyllosphaerae TaxID=3390502 RepID=UPI00397A20F8
MTESRLAEKTPPGSRMILLVVVGVVGILAGVAVGPVMSMLKRPDAPVAGTEPAAPLPSTDPGGFRFSPAGAPGETEVVDRAGNPVARFTDGARTVTLVGPSRTIAEPAYARSSVVTSTWVRLAPHPWHTGSEAEPWVRDWLSTALADRSPDVLAIAMQYTRDAPDRVDDQGVRYAGRARFGPELDDGRREIGADFYDYLGIPWRFADGTVKQPEPAQRGALDCSGFLRMVYGYRSGFPLLAGRSGDGLPRRADPMAHSGPGKVIIADEEQRPTDLDGIRPGDLLFFTTDDEPDIDHSAIYLGTDTDGRHRFISSRGGANAPTLGDEGGASVLDGEGFYANGFRTARRI